MQPRARALIVAVAPQPRQYQQQGWTTGPRRPEARQPAMMVQCCRLETPAPLRAMVARDGAPLWVQTCGAAALGSTAPHHCRLHLRLLVTTTAARHGRLRRESVP
jgi:hypothetical protein